MFRFQRKIVLAAFLGVAVLVGLLAHQMYGGGSGPSLKAVLSANHDAVELTWMPYPGAAAYQVWRSPLTADAYEFTLAAELSYGQTTFSDPIEDDGSTVYRVMAVGSRNYAYPLAAKLTVSRFGGLVPISLEFHPHSLATALKSLEPYGLIKDVNTGEFLDASSSLWPGQVLEVEGSRGKTLTMVGTMPTAVPLHIAPHQFKYFAVPLTEERWSLKGLKLLGLKDTAAHSYIFSDGNNIQLDEAEVYLPGQVYGLRSSRETRLDLANRLLYQGGEAAAPSAARPTFLGGSPDDGTAVVVLYDDAYETKLYKCWSGGKSGAWDGVTDNAVGADNVKNAAVVRRGRTMYVKDEAGMDETTPVTVLAPAAPGTGRQGAGWNISWDSPKGAAAIQIPAAAPVGDYQVRVGSDPENYVTVYIIFDPSFAASYLDANGYRSWAYVDEEWQTAVDLKNYLNYSFEGPGYPLGSNDDVYGYRGDWNSESGADGGVFGQRWVEMAATIHGSGAATPLEACLHAYGVVGQRITWVAGNGWYGNDSGVYNTFDDMLRGTIDAPKGGGIADELDVVTAERAALGLGWVDRLPANYVLEAGACFNFATCLSVMFRALGIPGRCQHSIGGDGWTSSFHTWAEACLGKPEIHPNQGTWWDGGWYELDCNDPYSLSLDTTSHSEGSITPVVINGYGDYLINEYIQCEGIGYDGSFYENSFECTPPGRDTGTHTAVPLQNGTTNDAEEHDSTPLVVEYDTSGSAWQLMNLFVPYDGPARPSGDQYVYDSHHGYALNDTQTGPSGGAGYIADSTNENDLPVLVEGVDQRGVIGGWGFMMYRVPVSGSSSITVELSEGADRVEILGSLDRNIYSSHKRWDLDYDFISDTNGQLVANTAGGDQLYLWLQLKGLSLSQPGLGQEVAWYTIRLGESTPPYCGDGACNGDETPETCPEDCGAQPYCGDDICNGEETPETCPEDCGSQPPYTITALAGMYVYYTGTTSIDSLRVGTKQNDGSRYWASAVKYDLPTSPVSAAVIKLQESSTMFCDNSNPGDTMQISRSAVTFDNIPTYGGIPNQVGTVANFSVTGCVKERVTAVDITAVINEAIQNGENTLLIRYQNFTNDDYLGQHRFYDKPELEITP